MDVLRTPGERFEALVDWPYEPHYTSVRAGGGASGPELRIAHAEAGAGTTGETVVLMHGEPSWSYLYRHMIQPIAAAGHRVLAPDLVGFGRSDKPASRADYTYAAHVDWMSQWLVSNVERGATLFCQDWGGLIGLRLVAAHPERFARVVAGNTFLPVGDGAPSEAFLAWREFSQTVPEFPAGLILDGGSARALSADEQAAYDAPFPDERYKEGARQFPMLVPTSPDDPERSANRRLAGPRGLDEAVSVHVQRRRRRHAWRRRHVPAAHPGLPGAIAYHGRRRALPAGGLPGPTGRGDPRRDRLNQGQPHRSFGAAGRQLADLAGTGRDGM